MSFLRAFGWFTLFGAASLSLVVESGALARARAPELRALESNLGVLKLGPELDFDVEALGSTPPERFAYFEIQDADGRAGTLFLAYYARAQRWSGRPHDLEKCFAAAGWQERESHRLEEAHRPWSRGFERPSPEGGLESIRVVHWLERPGPDEDRLAWSELLARAADGRGLRPDVISAYLQFAAEEAPDDARSAALVAALSAELERVWE
jgi:hypothetical protein